MEILHVVVVFVANGAIRTGGFLMHELAMWFVLAACIVFARWEIADNSEVFTGISSEETVL